MKYEDHSQLDIGRKMCDLSRIRFMNVSSSGPSLSVSPSLSNGNQENEISVQPTAASTAIVIMTPFCVEF